ncbi:ABC transporter permease [Luedemannella helvata]|uniref:ABC3 transporter permease C-terminal domain-containing protein n=1 Tax=Luedemannella helvata TaxID=349315 RepID=A0ABN2JZW1_9ACTN
MRPATLARLALAGSRTDTLRVVLTAASASLATLMFLVAAAVAAIPHFADSRNGSDDWARQYQLQVLVEPGLRPGVVMALALLTIPVLALAGQCARLGAPARDRRLAAIRLAGATPGQATLVAAAETGVASVVGSVLGLAVYLIGRRVLHRPDAEGRLPLPTDVLPPAWAIVAIVVGLPVLATAVAVVLLRGAAFTPYGIARRVRRRAPRMWVGLLMGVGIALVGTGQALTRWAPDLPDWVFPAQLLLGVAVAAGGLVFGTGWIAAATGRTLLRFARGPATLLAGRRLMADPWAGSRVFAVLLVGVLFGAGAAGMRALITTTLDAEAAKARWYAAQQGTESYPNQTAEFHTTAYNLVNGVVAVAITLSAAAMLVAVVEAWCPDGARTPRWSRPGCPGRSWPGPHCYRRSRPRCRPSLSRSSSAPRWSVSSAARCAPAGSPRICVLPGTRQSAPSRARGSSGRGCRSSSGRYRCRSTTWPCSARARSGPSRSPRPLACCSCGRRPTWPRCVRRNGCATTSR